MSGHVVVDALALGLDPAVNPHDALSRLPTMQESATTWLKSGGTQFVLP